MRPSIWVITLFTLFVLLVDAVLSLFWTCHIVGEQPSGYLSDCTPFNGPLIIALHWVSGLDDNPVIAFFTFVLAGSTIALWLSTEKAANAAARSAKIAEDSLFQLQRAYVNYGRLRYLSHLTPEGTVWWSLHFDWINSGSSPARRVRVYIGIYFENTDLPDDYPFDVPNELPELFIGPHGRITSTKGSVTTDDLTAVRNGSKFLYLWGRADYHDIFDNTPVRTSKFSVRVLGFRGDPSTVWNEKTNIVELILDTTPSRHNDAD